MLQLKKKAHLTREQRCQISILLQAGHTQKSRKQKDQGHEKGDKRRKRYK